MDSFQFTHPDPDKIWRMLKKWDSGFSWSREDLREFLSLCKEWSHYYSYMDDRDNAKKIIQKRDSIARLIREKRCLTKTTTQGDVKFASKRSNSRLETSL